MATNKFIRRFQDKKNRLMANLTFSYTKHLTSPLLEDHILLEAGQGLNINGNMFALLRELKTNLKWKDMKCVFVVTEGTKETAPKRMAEYGFEDIIYVERLSKQYNRYLATCRVLATDNSFPPYFHKRDDQVYLSTWHGTPLKTLGTSEKSTRRSFANIQRNYLMADYALFPNDYTKDVFFDDYCLRYIFRNQVLKCNYPRNEVFYREDPLGIREKMGLEGKQIFAYMPTWRGSDAKADIKTQIKTIENYLKEIEAGLTDDQFFYVNLHFLVNNSIDYSKFRKIRQFPKEYETYDFLNVCDALVTDYSSVFFDYAVTGRKVVLFAYDKDEYLSTRGMYLDPETLPFPLVQTTEELLKELNDYENVEDRTDFLKDFCPNGSDHISNDILELTINGTDRGLDVSDNEDAEDDIELIFDGNIMKKSMDTVMEYIEESPFKKHIFAYRGTLSYAKIEFLNELPDNVIPLGLVRAVQYTFPEAACAAWGKLTGKTNNETKGLKRFYKRERDAMYHTIKPKKVVDFSSRNPLTTGILNSFDCEYEDRHIPSRNDYMAKDLFPIKYNSGGNMNVVSLVRFKSITPFCLSEMRIVVDENVYPVKIICGNKNKLSKKHTAIWKISIPTEDILTMGKNNNIRVSFGFADAYEDPVTRNIYYNWIFRSMSVAAHGPAYIDKEHGITACIRQKGGNFMQLMVRDLNKTDAKIEQVKLFFAYWLSKFMFGKDIVLLFEKDSSKYEESASVVYEQLIDDGYENVWFIIDRDYPFIDDIPAKYRKHLLYKCTFKHYLYFFRSKTFISSEAIAHALDTSMFNKLALKKILSNDMSYVFLQHGVMYMVSLDSPSRTFFKRKELSGKYRVVVSSRKEADHFVEQGLHENEDLYICGLPKFDRNEWNEDSTQIVIMPTWRPWESNEVQVDPTSSKYYKMIKRIVSAIPEEYQDRIMILPHPLFLARIQKSDDPLKDKLKVTEKYDTILKNTALLITDYSSISFDAYYRGAQVIFYWEEKDECMEEYGMGTRLMLNEENVFAPVAYNEEQLTEAFNEVYLKPHSEYYQKKYDEIVEFHDGQNTKRLIQMLKNDELI